MVTFVRPTSQTQSHMLMKLRTYLIAAALLASACSHDDEPAPAVGGRTIAVVIGSSSESRPATAGTRTEIDTDDGQTIRWSTDDRIALWAVDAAQGTAAFEALPFRMYHYDETFDRARFTGDIPEMTAGTYAYYAVSPLPESFSGTRATFEIPAVQRIENGAAKGGYTRLPHDVMIAAPIADAGELTEGDNSDRISLRFSHKVHLLKLTVRGNALGEPVSEMDLIFPQPVVGRLTLDVADPDAPAELAESGNTLTLRFAEPVEPGTTVFAAIVPTDLTGEEIRIISYGETGFSEQRSFTPKKAFEAGHTTPLAYDIPAMGAPYTHLVVSLPEDKGTLTLGEEVRKATLTAPEGALFDNGSNVRDIAFDAEGRAVIRFKPAWVDNLSGKEVAVTFESDHARVDARRTVVMPAIEPNAGNAIGVEVPYLFEEDFSGTTTHSNNGALNSTGHQSTTQWCDDWGLPGWSGNQFHIEGGKALAIRHQAEKFFLLGTYRGRMDSAPIGAGLKVPTRVHVFFNYTGKNNPGGTPVLTYGFTTDQSALFGYYQGGSAAIKGGTLIENAKGTVNVPTDGTLGDLNPETAPSIEFDIDDCHDQHRLSWDCAVASPPSRNSQQWVFIDNIRVSIVAQ